MTSLKVAQVPAQLIPLDQLHELPDNPNEQDTPTFENLVSDVEEDGFTQALEVVPRSVFHPYLEGYYVVSGNHRLKAVTRLGAEAVDCVVHDHWDADTALVNVVRRNMVHGYTNPEKFSRLVDKLNGFTHDQLADAMGFEDIEAFADLYQRQNQGGGPGRPEDPVANLIDGLGLVLNQLFSEYGDTVPHGFLYFLYGKKIHLAVLTTPRLKNVLNRIAKRCNKQGLDMAKVLGVLLETGMEAVDFEKKKQEAEDYADGGTGDEELEPVVGRPAPDDDLEEDSGETA
jgi:hypothetical protein